MKPPLTPPLIFAAFSNDFQRYLKNLRNESNHLESLFLDKDKLCEIKCRYAIRPEDLYEVFLHKKEQIHIFHYGGHADGYQFLLNDDENNLVKFGGKGIVALLAGLPNLKLAFLNGCLTETMALQLYESGIPAVIGSTTKIPDEMAYQLSMAFYKAIAAQETLEEAWNSAKAFMEGKFIDAVDFRAVIWDEEEKEKATPTTWFCRMTEEAKKWKLTELPTLPKRLNQVQIRPKDKIIGRGKELADLHLLLAEKTPVLLVNGMGGIGKTTVAQVYVHVYEAEYRHIIWLFAGTDPKDTLLADRLLHQNLEIAEEMEKALLAQQPEKAWALLLATLQSLPERCLFIADNIDTSKQEKQNNAFHFLKSLKDQLPNFHFLLTSRENFVSFQLFPLGFLPLAEARELFYFYYTAEDANLPKEDNLVTEIVTIAGRHTLTIELLAKIVATRAKHDFAQLIRELKQGGFDVARAIAIESDYDKRNTYLMDILLTAFDLSHILAQPLAQHLLTQFSVLPTLSMSYELLSDILPIPTEEEDTYSMSLKTLVQKGWLQYNGTEEIGYSCHPVLQDVLRSKLLPNAEKCEGMIDALNSKIYDEGLTNRLDAKDYLVYTDSLVLYLEGDNTRIATLCNNVALTYEALGDLPKYLEYGRKALGILEKVLPSEHPNLAASYHNMSGTYRALGDLPKSLAYGLKALGILEKVLPSEHPNLAASYSNVAITYKALSNLPKSLEYGLKALGIKEKILSPEDPSLATSYDNVANTYQALGDLAKSLEYGRKALGIFEKILSPEHPSLATSYNNIGETYRALGNLAKSLECGLKALGIFEKILSPEHPSLATSYHNMSGTYQALGNLPKSLEYGLKALGIRKKILSPEHPDLATSYSNMAITCYYMKDWEKALNYSQLALGIVLKVLPFGHYNTKTFVNTMGGILQAAIAEKGQAWAMPYIKWYVEKCGAYLKE